MGELGGVDPRLLRDVELVLLFDLVYGLLDILGNFGVEPALRNPWWWLLGVGRGGHTGDVGDLLRVVEVAEAPASPV